MSAKLQTRIVSSLFTLVASLTACVDQPVDDEAVDSVESIDSIDSIDDVDGLQAVEASEIAARCNVLNIPGRYPQPQPPVSDEPVKPGAPQPTLCPPPPKAIPSFEHVEATEIGPGAKQDTTPSTDDSDEPDLPTKYPAERGPKHAPLY